MGDPSNVAPERERRISGKRRCPTRVRRKEVDVSKTSYILIPGAGGDAWYWHLLTDHLEVRGHEVVAVSLPASDDSAGWAEYTDTIVGAIGDRTGVILVAQSLGGFSAPLACARVPVELLVLVNAMIAGRARQGLSGGPTPANKKRCTPSSPPWVCRLSPPTTRRRSTSTMSRRRSGHRRFSAASQCNRGHR
jgi:alpha-beta hydrolase superfamily lysophospholipase